MPQLSPRARVTKGALFTYLAPRLAQDARIDLDSIVAEITHKNFNRPALATALRRSTAGNLAADADLNDVAEFLEAVERMSGEEGEDTSTEGNSAFPMAGETEEDGWRRRAHDARRHLGRDETDEEREEREERQGAEDARRRLGRDETPEECSARESAMDARHARDRRVRRAEDARRRLGRDESEEERRARENEEGAADRRRAEDKKRARDSRRADDARRAEDRRRAEDTRRRSAEDRRRASDRRRAEDKWVRRAEDAKRRLGRDETEEERYEREEREEGEDRAAEDARRSAEDNRRAMDEAITSALAQERTNQKAIREAERFIRPWVGDLSGDLAFDSADDVFRKALEMRGHNVDGIHPSAYRMILEMSPKPGAAPAARTGLAQDARMPAGVKSTAERFPNAARIQVLG